MVTTDIDREPIPTPQKKIPGLPQWADLQPTNTELVATIAALPALRESLADAERALAAAKTNPEYLSIPEFTRPAGGLADLDAYMEAAKAHHLALTSEQRGARNAVSGAGELRESLHRMVLFATDHEVIDGIAVRIRRSSTLSFETLQIASNASDVRRYCEAEQNADGTWCLELGDLDTARARPDDLPHVVAPGEAAARRIGLEHVLAPMRGAS